MPYNNYVRSPEVKEKKIPGISSGRCILVGVWGMCIMWCGGSGGCYFILHTGTLDRVR